MNDKKQPVNLKHSSSVLDGVSKNLPELSRAVELTRQAATIGFDWSSIVPVFSKMNEEIIELETAIASGNKENILDELGDVIFVCTNLARHLKIDPRLALQHANDKFENRFRLVEKKAMNNFPNQSSFDLQVLDNYWKDVKKLEK